MATVRTVQQDREVVFGGDVRTNRNHDLLHDVALNVEAEDRLSLLVGLVGGVSEFDATSFAAATRLHLSLDNQQGGTLRQQLARTLTRLLGGRRQAVVKHGHPVPLEHLPSLVLVKIHLIPSVERGVVSAIILTWDR